MEADNLVVNHPRLRIGALPDIPAICAKIRQAVGEWQRKPKGLSQCQSQSRDIQAAEILLENLLDAHDLIPSSLEHLPILYNTLRSIANVWCSDGQTIHAMLKSIKAEKGLEVEVDLSDFGHGIVRYTLQDEEPGPVASALRDCTQPDAQQAGQIMVGYLHDHQIFERMLPQDALFLFSHITTGGPMPRTWDECHQSLGQCKKRPILDVFIHRCLEEAKEWEQMQIYSHLTNPEAQFRALWDLVDRTAQPPSELMIHLVTQGCATQVLGIVQNCLAARLESLPAETLVRTLDHLMRTGSPSPQADWAREELLSRVTKDQPTGIQAVLAAHLVEERRLATSGKANYYRLFLAHIWREIAPQLTSLLNGELGRSQVAWDLLKALPADAAKRIILKVQSTGLTREQQKLLGPFLQKTGSKSDKAKKEKLPPAPSPSAYDRLLNALENGNGSDAEKYLRRIGYLGSNQLAGACDALAQVETKKRRPLAELAAQIWGARVDQEKSVRRRAELFLEGRAWGAAFSELKQAEALKDLLLSENIVEARELLQGSQPLCDRLKQEMRSSADRLRLITTVGNQIIQGPKLAEILLAELPSISYQKAPEVKKAEGAVLALLRGAVYLSEETQEKLRPALYDLLHKKVGPGPAHAAFSPKGQERMIALLAVLGGLATNFSQIQAESDLRKIPPAAHVKESVAKLLSSHVERAHTLLDRGQVTTLGALSSTFAVTEDLIDFLGEQAADYAATATQMLLTVSGKIASSSLQDINTECNLWTSLSQSEPPPGPEIEQLYRTYIQRLIECSIGEERKALLVWQALGAGKALGYLSQKEALCAAGTQMHTGASLPLCLSLAQWWEGSQLLTPEEMAPLYDERPPLATGVEESLLSDLIFLTSGSSAARHHKEWLTAALRHGLKNRNVELINHVVESLAIRTGMGLDPINLEEFHLESASSVQHNGEVISLRDLESMEDLLQGATFWSRALHFGSPVPGPDCEGVAALLDPQVQCIATPTKRQVRMACLALRLQLTNLMLALGTSQEKESHDQDGINNLKIIIGRLDRFWSVVSPPDGEDTVDQETMSSLEIVKGMVANQDARKRVTTSRREVDGKQQLLVQIHHPEAASFLNPLLVQADLYRLSARMKVERGVQLGADIGATLTKCLTGDRDSGYRLQFGRGVSAFKLVDTYIRKHWDWEGLLALSTADGLKALYAAYPAHMNRLTDDLLIRGIAEARSSQDLRMLFCFWNIRVQVGKLGLHHAMGQLEALIARCIQLPEARGFGLELVTSNFAMALKVRGSYYGFLALLKK